MQQALHLIQGSAAWMLMIALGWTVWTLIRDSYQKTKKLHQIPCANCQFFTNSHYLKCPVHPDSALTEAAIRCPDYSPCS